MVIFNSIVLPKDRTSLQVTHFNYSITREIICCCQKHMSSMSELYIDSNNKLINRENKKVIVIDVHIANTSSHFN